MPTLPNLDGVGAIGLPSAFLLSRQKMRFAARHLLIRHLQIRDFRCGY